MSNSNNQTGARARAGFQRSSVAPERDDWSKDEAEVKERSSLISPPPASLPPPFPWKQFWRLRGSERSALIWRMMRPLWSRHASRDFPVEAPFYFPHTEIDKLNWSY